MTAPTRDAALKRHARIAALQNRAMTALADRGELNTAQLLKAMNTTPMIGMELLTDLASSGAVHRRALPAAKNQKSQWSFRLPDVPSGDALVDVSAVHRAAYRACTAARYTRAGLLEQMQRACPGVGPVDAQAALSALFHAGHVIYRPVGHTVVIRPGTPPVARAHTRAA